MTGSPAQQIVVVGIDGSRAAVDAALWALDEAISRDIPLRLVYALDDGDRGPHDVAGKAAAAERAIRQVTAAIDGTGKPVKVEADIIRGQAADVLIRASREAAVLCVGAFGLSHFQPGRLGSTAVAVALSAHCPVAIVRQPRYPARPLGEWIIAVSDDSPDDGLVLATAVKEARLRNASLRVITCWRPPRDGTTAVAQGDRRICATLDRRLSQWRRRYPDCRIEAAAAHVSISEYLTTQAAESQLIVVGARGTGHVREIVGAVGNAALRGSDCVVLVVNRQYL